MKRQKTQLEKNNKLIAVKIYFTDAQLVDRIANVADGLGVSISAAAGMIIRSGIADVEKATDEILGQVKNEKKKST
jgi:hypothetical protein